MPSQPDRFRRFEVEDIGDVSVVAFVDERIIVEQRTQWLGEDLARLVDDFGRRNVLLDFANVEFMSTTAVGRLITLHRKLQSVKGKLVLWNVPSDILDAFQITRLDRLIPLAAGRVSLTEMLDARFGVTFRPEPFAPEWRTGTVVLLARQMFESGNFSAMPILADALQDAGCDNDDVLNHCRGPGFHARGCPVIGLVLGRG